MGTRAHASQNSTSAALDGPSFIVTTTSDALISHSTELSASSETAETSTSMATEIMVTTSTTELTTEFPTTSSTDKTVTSTVPISTTTKEPVLSGLFLNPSFDEPNPGGEFNGSPWTLEDGPSSSVSINPGLARTGSHSVYWSITATSENGGTVKQEISFESNHVYTLSYWWYIDEDVQPRNLEGCYIMIRQQGTHGPSSYFPDFLELPSPRPLKTWIKQEIQFNAERLSPAYIEFGAYCFLNASTGFKLAIDDTQLVY